MYEWRFDRNFRLVVTREDDYACIALIGELDAVTAKNLEQRATLPALRGSDVVVDLSALEAADTAGARAIRRIESLYSGCELRGPRAHILELLELMPRTLA